MVAACAACGQVNPEIARFCLACGAPVEPVDRPVAEERKTVTVLFCDLVGFTAASDGADPEDVRARIGPYHARLRTVIEGFGGTVEKFIGDAVMAVFGAPVAHEDDPERAVRAGLRILEAIVNLNEDDPGRGLAVRVGVESGEAVVALGARPQLGEALVAGDVVNTASRLQGAAPVGGVLAGPGTYAATRRAFDYQPLDPVVLKGKAEPVPVFRALAPRARLGTDVTRSLGAPMVGRRADLSILTGAFQKVVQEPAVQLVVVAGEPGVGKSRLVAELGSFVDAWPDLVRWRQGRCLPYGEGITFWALGEIVKAEAGILESDPPQAAAAKIDAVIPEDAPEAPWLRARLRPLAGLAAPAAAREENFAAWRAFAELLAEDRPSVLVFEDLHWADAALLEFLEQLAWLRRGRAAAAGGHHPAGAVRAGARVGGLGPQPGQGEPAAADGGRDRAADRRPAEHRGAARRGAAGDRGPLRRQPTVRRAVRPVAPGPADLEAGRRAVAAGTGRGDPGAARRAGADRGPAGYPAAPNANSCCTTPRWSARCSGPPRSRRWAGTTKTRCARRSVTWPAPSWSARPGARRWQARPSTPSPTR